MPGRHSRMAMARDAVARGLEQLVREEKAFRAHQYGGYRPVACDLVGSSVHGSRTVRPSTTRPQQGRRYLPFRWASRRALGRSARSVWPSCLLVQGESTDTSETALQTRLLQRANEQLADDEALVCDRGFPPTAPDGRYSTLCRPRSCQLYGAAGCPPSVSREGAQARPWRAGPASRGYKGRTIAATPPDRHETRQLHTGPTPLWLHAEFWDDLVCTDAQPGAPTFSTALIHDPRFDEPLLVNTAAVDGGPPQAFYRDRWPVEGLPLTAKQMLGAARQFVFAPESRQRLPELALVAGAILMYVAATQPAIPTGFWDRRRRRRQASAAPCRGALCRLGGAA